MFGTRTLAIPLSLFLSAATQAPHGLPLQGEEAEEFLKSAKVVGRRTLEVGITRPEQFTLSDGNRTLKAVCKTVDQFRPGITRFDQGGFEVDFQDSYKNEVAAYELDKILGLNLVPPTVERTIQGQRGCLQLWVEGSMTELDRKKKNLRTSDPQSWNEQMFKVRLLHQITHNTDFNNIRNILVDPDFRIYAIDHSRSFRLSETLLAEEDLVRFSRSALARLRRLDRATLEEKMGRWLSAKQIDALLKRRDLIVSRADRLVAEKGEEAVLYP